MEEKKEELLQIIENSRNRINAYRDALAELRSYYAKEYEIEPDIIEQYSEEDFYEGFLIPYSLVEKILQPVALEYFNANLSYVAFPDIFKFIQNKFKNYVCSIISKVTFNLAHIDSIAVLKKLYEIISDHLQGPFYNDKTESWYIEIDRIRDVKKVEIYPDNWEEFCQFAVTHNALAIFDIDGTLSTRVLEIFLSKDYSHLYYNGDWFLDIKGKVPQDARSVNPHDRILFNANVEDMLEFYKLALKKDAELIRYIRNPSEELQVLAASLKPKSIFMLQNATEAAKMAAVGQDSSIIRLINSPSEELQLFALQKNVKNVKHLHEFTYASVLNFVAKSGEFSVNPYGDNFVVEEKHNGKVVWKGEFVLMDDRDKVEGLSARVKEVACGLDIGSRVTHTFFGEGRVISVDYRGYITVQFDSGKAAEFCSDSIAENLVRPLAA